MKLIFNYGISKIFKNIIYLLIQLIFNNIFNKRKVLYRKFWLSQ